MATQVQTATEGAQEQTSGATGGAADGATDKVQGYTSGILGGIEGYANKAKEWGMGLVDRFFPPEQRATVLAKIQEFMLANPKISVCLNLPTYAIFAH